MPEFFDIYTLIYLVIAVVVLLRLRRSLGQRTGNEKQHPQDRFGGSEKADNSATPEPANDDKVVTLPGSGRRTAAARNAARPAARDWGDFAKPRSNRAKTFNSIVEIDGNFDPAEFVQGARAAYEMIVTGFAEGDRDTLQSLLSPEVYGEFLEAISARTKREERIESSFVSIDKIDIKDAQLKGSTAHMVVSFVSQMITATLDKAGDVIDGDPNTVIQVNDVWTFARDLNASNPNWKLVATGS